MNRRDVVIGLGVIAVLAVVIYFWQRPREPEELRVPQTLSVEDQIEEAFDLEIPEDVEKVELVDITSSGYTAMATRKYENGRFELNILADLPEGKYTAEIMNEEGEAKLLGNLRIAKGGYLLELQTSQDLRDYSKVRVKMGDKEVLEGKF